MSFPMVNIAILLRIIGNLTASLSDAAVKLLNGDISPFQYIFIWQLFSTLVICPLWLQQPKKKRKLYDVKLNIFRADLIIIGSGCMVIAITHLTLATANAVFHADFKQFRLFNLYFHAIFTLFGCILFFIFKSMGCIIYLRSFLLFGHSSCEY